MLNVATAIMNTCPAERHETREKGAVGGVEGKGTTLPGLKPGIKSLKSIIFHKQRKPVKHDRGCSVFHIAAEKRRLKLVETFCNRILNLMVWNVMTPWAVATRPQLFKRWITLFSKIQLVVYYQCCVLIG